MSNPEAEELHGERVLCVLWLFQGSPGAATSISFYWVFGKVYEGNSDGKPQSVLPA